MEPAKGALRLQLAGLLPFSIMRLEMRRRLRAVELFYYKNVYSDLLVLVSTSRRVGPARRGAAYLPCMHACTPTPYGIGMAWRGKQHALKAGACTDLLGYSTYLSFDGNGSSEMQRQVHEI